MYVDTQTMPALFALLTQLNAQKSLLGETINGSLGQLNEIATKIGFELLALESYDKAELCLTIAAAQGKAQAQYAMATCVTRRDGGFRIASQETRQWLRLAAAQDYVPALMRLGDTQSLRNAAEILTPKAEAGDTQAMSFLFKLDKDVNWLKKAVALNDSSAQFELAEAYHDTPQLIPNAVERHALIEELRQKAADGGSVPALAERVFSQTSTADILEKQQRLVQLALLGQLDALMEYGYALAGMPQINQGLSLVVQRHTVAPRTYGLERDFAKAYAVLGMVLPKLTNPLAAENLQHDMDAIWHQMTPQQYSASEAIRVSLHERIEHVFKSIVPFIIVGAPH